MNGVYWGVRKQIVNQHESNQNFAIEIVLESDTTIGALVCTSETVIKLAL